jgi:hypothetical protein
MTKISGSGSTGTKMSQIRNTARETEELLLPVLRIRIRIQLRRIRTSIFLGPLDPDPLVRGMDPDPVLHHQAK